MKVNRQFQDLHTHGDSGTDWCAVQTVERDICLLFHQLADYSYIMGDLYYGNVFALDYWQFLQLPNLEPERQQFIRNGCLVMLYAMASEVLDGSGSYLTMDRKRYSTAKAAVHSLPSFDSDTDRLIASVSGAFKLIDENRFDNEQTPEMQDVVGASTWIHERFVRRYFISRASDFENNPYFRGAPPE